MRSRINLIGCVAAFAIAASGPVFANTNIIPGSLGDGSLFLNVVDQTAQTSYTLDLSALNASDRVNEFNGSVFQAADAPDAAPVGPRPDGCHRPPWQVVLL